MKRINEFKRNKIFILNSLNDYRFKLYFLIILILSIYCTSSVFKSNIFLETYYSFINSWVFLVLSFVFTIVTLDFCKKYSNKYSLMIRHKNKSTFIKKLIFPFFIICSSIFLIFLLLIFSLLIIKNGPLPHTFKFVYDLNISFYLVYVILRFFIFLMLFSFFIYMCYFLVGPNITFAIYIVISLFQFFCSSNKLFFPYFLNGFLYDNFFMDLTYTVGNILVFEVLIYLIYKSLSLNKTFIVGKIKFIFLKSFYSIKKKIKIILPMLISYIILLIFILSNYKNSGYSSANLFYGNIAETDLLFLLQKTVKSFLTIYIGYYFIVSDLNRAKEYLFLRMQKKDWFLYKNLFLTISIIIFKLASFALYIILKSVYHYNDSVNFILVISDLFYILTIIELIYFLIFSSFSKINILKIILFLLFTIIYILKGFYIGLPLIVILYFTLFLLNYVKTIKGSNVIYF